MVMLNRPVELSNVKSTAAKQPRQAIALISDHGDPAAEIGREEAGGQNVYVRQVGESLAKLGWQVDMFTRKVRPDDATIVQHTPHCRTIRLTAGPEAFVPRDQLMEHMPAFVEAFQKFQAKEGSNYPLIHTNYWLSAWVGLQLKQRSNVQLIHTYHSLGAVKYQTVEKPASAALRLHCGDQPPRRSHAADVGFAIRQCQSYSLRHRFRKLPCYPTIGGPQKVRLKQYR
jgi:D-inositol-3-phosphate glycosyltransferase